MKNLQVFTILFLLSIGQIYSQHVLTLKPYGNMGNNAMIWTTNPDLNLAGWGELKMSAWTWDGNDGVERSMLYFNLNLLPANAVIFSAKLSLYGNDGNPENNSTLDGSNECLVQRITTNWDPATVTWNTQPNSDTVHEVVLPESVSQWQDYLNIDVTDLIRDLYETPDSYTGLMIKLKTEISYRRLVFRSAFQVDSVKSPTLKITYSGVGINELSDEGYLSITPNPAISKFSIKRGSCLNEASIEIYNSLGKKIMNDKFSCGDKNKEIILDVSSGTYLVKVIDGNKQYMKKLLLM